MKLKIAAFWAACLLIAPAFLFAQTSHRLSGLVKEPGGKELDGAAVYLYRDSVLVKTALADQKGRFLLNAPEGRYRIQVNLMGYQSYSGTTFAFKADLELPIIVLVAAEKTLKEVTVTSQRPFVQQKIDRTVINPESMISAAGGTALDVLEKAPGVIVDQDAAISLKGKGVTVFVDNKPTYVSGSQLESYLRSISASSIDQIELMPNPPAGYDAAGNGGVINIRIKKNQARGFNGAVNLGLTQGKYLKHNDNANFNYRYNQLNLVGNLGYNRQNDFSDLLINRHFFTEAGQSFSNMVQNSFLRRTNHNYSLRLGADYYLDDQSTLGINVNGQSNPSETRSPVKNQFSNAAGVPDSVIFAQNQEHEMFRNAGINLNFRHQFDKNGRQLSADADYLAYSTDNDQRFDNASFDAAGNTKLQDLLTGSLPSSIHIYSGKADYEHPLAGGMKLAAGLKSSYTYTDNIANYFYTVGNRVTPDYDKTNHFRYDETIHAAYLNANRDFKRFSFQLGLRIENTSSKGHQLGNMQKTDSTFKRNYTNLFPTIYFQFKLDTAGKHQLNLNYGRRIDRPYYQDLNPFLSPLDKFTYYAGNPFLKPSFSDNIELSHIFKSRFTTTLSYSRTLDDVNETIEIVEGIYYSRPGNIGRSTVKSLSFNGTEDISSWFNVQLYGRLAQIHSVSNFYNGQLDAKGSYIFARASLTFKPGKDWTLQVEGGGQSRITSAQFDLGPRGRINLALSKKLSASTTLKVVGNDLLYTFKNTGVINNLRNTTADWRNLGDTRTVVLSLNCRFGKAISNQRQHEANGAEAEQSRVKN